MVAHNVTITGYPLPGINFPNQTEKKLFTIWYYPFPEKVWGSLYFDSGWLETRNCNCSFSIAFLAGYSSSSRANKIATAGDA